MSRFSFRRIGFVALALYVTLYLVLSRIGFHWSRSINAEGFYFVIPIDPLSHAVNYTCVVVFYPLILVDIALGTGLSPASPPLLELSG